MRPNFRLLICIAILALPNIAASDPNDLILKRISETPESIDFTFTAPNPPEGPICHFVTNDDLGSISFFIEVRNPFGHVHVLNLPDYLAGGFGKISVSAAQIQLRETTITIAKDRLDALQAQAVRLRKSLFRCPPAFRTWRVRTPYIELSFAGLKELYPDQMIFESHWLSFDNGVWQETH